MLAKDLKKEFASTEVFSTRNLWNMRAFYDEYKENKILQQLVAEIPWGHNLLILNKEKDENPSIGIILCAGKDNFDFEYALRGIHKPMGVSEYRLTKELPPELRDSLPSIEDIEMELSKKLIPNPSLSKREGSKEVEVSGD